MNRQTKPLKPYHGLIVLILTAVCIFLIGPVLSNYMGLYGTLISELLMLAGAVGCTFLFRGNPKYVFPIHKPTPHGLFGTFLFWMGTIGIAMVFTVVLACFFRMKSWEQVQDFLIHSKCSVLVAVLIVSITPAFCEEAVFRGIGL